MKKSSQSIGLEPGPDFQPPRMALDDLPNWTLLEGGRMCGACGTKWNAPVDECPECGNTNVDELAALSGVPDDMVAAVRRDERMKISRLLDESAEVIGRFALDGAARVHLIAYMIKLGNDESPERS